ncbi:hypothetical protein [Amycolatopsis nalaikhensis]|uniref:Uncharacterized protein n=1 Tax=Amycolatopsis nalaikhensis TaxID=715472 RepID=A0ABY8XU72_9PSEU|nr:hypothetical protein [Amycolatopsis sp. 2-2]WIV59227.1 hypothetical protein QP939_11650 [Amycolatopsis sp. 2-2]
MEISTTSGIDYRAADGQEFLRLSATNPASSDGSAEGVTAQVVRDGAAHPVRLAELETGGLVVSVPKGHTATLQVTDEGRTQSLDLRTGRRGADAIPGYYPKHALTWQRNDYSGSGKTAVGGCRQATTMLMTFGLGETAVEPWGPGLGWARPGRGWLPISYISALAPVTLPDYDSIKDMPPPCAITMDFRWDLTRSVGVQTPEGEAAPARVFSDNGAGGTLVYDVPLSLTTATMVVHPAGAYHDETGHDHPISWTTPPQISRTDLLAAK